MLHGSFTARMRKKVSTFTSVTHEMDKTDSPFDLSMAVAVGERKVFESILNERGP